MVQPHCKQLALLPDQLPGGQPPHLYPCHLYQPRTNGLGHPYHGKLTLHTFEQLCIVSEQSSNLVIEDYSYFLAPSLDQPEYVFKYIPCPCGVPRLAQGPTGAATPLWGCCNRCGGSYPSARPKFCFQDVMACGCLIILTVFQHRVMLMV